MRTNRLHPGSLLLEALLGIAVFSFFLTAVGVSLISGQEGSINAGDRIRGALYAQKTIEAARSVRDGSFSSLAAGTYGVSLGATTWSLQGTGSTAGNYRMKVSVSSLGSGWLQLTGQASWKRGYARAGTAVLVTELTDWRTAGSIGNWSSLTLDGSYSPGGSPLFTSAAIAGNTLFVAADASSGGRGLYLFDITTPSSPARIAPSFDLGATAYGVAVRGKRLYVLTNSASAEIRVYDIASPSSFSSSSLVTSYDLPGSGLGRAIALDGVTLLVGAAYSASAGQYELYRFDVTNSGSVVYRAGLDDSGTVGSIAVSGDLAYLASSYDAGELRVADISGTGSLSLGGGYNLSDRTADGLSVAVSGTSALLGTQANGGIQEMVLFDTEDAGVPVPPPGPWYHEGSGSLVGMAMDPARCVAFLAAQSGREALQVVNIRNKTSLPQIASYDASTLGRGLLYDPIRDRLFLLTQSSLLVFRPGTSTGTCP